MLRTGDDRPTLWEVLLAPEALVMSAELAEVDGLLNDPAVFVPFRAFFSGWAGWPSIPMETSLRMMVWCWATSWLVM